MPDGLGFTHYNLSESGMREVLPWYVRENEFVTILETGEDVAKIRTEDGLEGWIGGFHMVID